MWRGLGQKCNALVILFVKSTEIPMCVCIQYKWYQATNLISSNQLKTVKKNVLPVKDANESNTAIKFKGIYLVGSANSFEFLVKL